MPIYNPAISANITDIPTDAGFLLSPPIAWNTVAAQIAVESGSTVDGNHIYEKGELHGSAQPKLQDTYISGTASRTGKAFTVLAGTVHDTWVNLRNSKYGLLFPDSTSGATAPDVVAAAPDSRIYCADFVIRRGLAPVALVPTAATLNAYVHLCYLNSEDYRIAIESGKPLRLDYYDGTWHNGVFISKTVNDIDAYLSMSGDQITLRVLPDYNDNTLTVKVGNHVALTHSPRAGLPAYGNVRYTVRNGDSSFQYFPLRFQPLVVSKSQKDFGEVKPSASVAINSRGVTDPTQTAVTTTTGDGQNVGYSVTARLPDAGDGLGSIDPAKLVDACLVIPAVWTGGGLPSTIFQPPIMTADIVETLDDATRTYTSSAALTINNWNNFYTGSYGHVAVQLAIATGVDPYAYCFKGVGGGGPRGIEFFRLDPTRLMMLPCSDDSFKMMVPLGQEVCFDGWCIFSAVRFLAECGNIHPQFLQSIPLYVPPGATQSAPYGPAGEDCPFFVLARGSGLNAKYKYLPEATPWSILQRLVQDAGETDPLTGANVPYYMGHTPDSQFHFETYNPRNQQPVIAYLENDVSGYGQIQEIRVYNSVYQMRTSIDFQGIDAFTNELLYYHLNMPDAVMKAVGFRYAWLERDARFASADYMQTIADNAAVQASLPTQVVTVKVPFHPQIRAGMTCIIGESSALGRGGVFYITEIRSQVGLDGDGMTQSCHSFVTARAVENF